MNLIPLPGKKNTFEEKKKTREESKKQEVLGEVQNASDSSGVPAVLCVVPAEHQIFPLCTFYAFKERSKWLPPVCLGQSVYVLLQSSPDP